MTAKPLAGVIVVDLSRYLPGPFTSHLLASLGARVIKVEEPRLGDPVRYAPPLKDGVGSLAAQVLSGLESIALDLKKPAGVDVLTRLLTQADVLLETFRPGGLAKAGLAPESLRQRFPDLVICSLSGWGQEGPLAHRAGHDLTYQAIAGSLAPTAEVPAMPSGDLLGAWSAATAILAALVHRQRSQLEGKPGGTWIDASLYDASLHGNLVSWAAEVPGAKAVGEPHDLAGALPGYRLYRTADRGWVAVALLEPKFWRGFCRVMDRKDLLSLRSDRSQAARAQMAEVFRARDRQFWEAFFETHDLPGAVVLSPEEAVTHAQATARGVVIKGDDGLPRLMFPARFDGSRPGTDSAIPTLGQHTHELLEELGIHAKDLPRWKARSGVGKRLGLKRWLARWLMERKG